MLSLVAFLLLPLVALGVRRRRGVRALVIVMVIAGALIDSDAQFHFLTMLGTAGYDSTTIWAQVAATTVAYIWFPDSRGLRFVQFSGTVLLCLFLMWTLSTRLVS
jgi:hypothetical protein